MKHCNIIAFHFMQLSNLGSGTSIVAWVMRQWVVNNLRIFPLYVVEYWGIVNEVVRYIVKHF